MPLVVRSVTVVTDSAGILSDADLLNLVRAGDAEAYGQLYQRHEAAARRLARELVQTPADVDDAVAESFTRVLSATRRGGGPTDAFRPYLLTAVRHLCYDRLRGERSQIPADERQLADAGEPVIDQAVADLEWSLIARAFRSLPERWSAVLWHTEIERNSPAQVAPLLGLTPNAVAALSYRAREGLRQAYLQMHVGSQGKPSCQPVTGKLGAYVRGALSKRDLAMVDEHLAECDACRGVYAELTDVNTALRATVAPLVLGGAAEAYLAGEGHAAAAAAAAHGHSAAGGVTRLLRAGRPGPRLAAAGGALAAILVATIAVALAGNDSSDGSHKPQHLAAAQPTLSPTPGASSPSGPRGKRRPVAKRRSGRAHATPGASRSPHHSPRPRPTPTQSAPSPTPSPTPAPQLSAQVQVFGPHGHQQDAWVAFQVTDAGVGTSELTAQISLPSGAALQSGGSGPQPGGWTCSQDGTGASCQHAAIPAGGQAPGGIPIQVTGSQACGQNVQLTVSSGASSAGAQSSIQCGDGVSAQSIQYLRMSLAPSSVKPVDSSLPPMRSMIVLEATLSSSQVTMTRSTPTALAMTSA
jgi:RNA polymerase sigma factor (sigma-70 family)